MSLRPLACLGTGLLTLGCLSPQPTPPQAKPPSVVLTENNAKRAAKKTYNFGPPPCYAWASTMVTNLGLGKARVELYCGGRKVSSRDFELVEARWNQTQSLPMPLPSPKI